MKSTAFPIRTFHLLPHPTLYQHFYGKLKIDPTIIYVYDVTVHVQIDLFVCMSALRLFFPHPPSPRVHLSLMHDREKTRPETRLPKSRAGGQGPYLRSPDHLGRSSEVKEKKS